MCSYSLNTIKDFCARINMQLQCVKHINEKDCHACEKLHCSDVSEVNDKNQSNFHNLEIRNVSLYSY